MVTTLKYGTKKDSIVRLLSKLAKSTTRGINARKYSGIITLVGDPLQIQKALRNEWE